MYKITWKGFLDKAEKSIVLKTASVKIFVGLLISDVKPDYIHVEVTSQ